MGPSGFQGESLRQAGGRSIPVLVAKLPYSFPQAFPILGTQGPKNLYESYDGA